MTSFQGRRRTRRGFTLIEMLIVLAVLAMLAAMAWPSLRGLLAKSRLRDAAGQVRIELAKARTRAIQTGTAQHFRFQPGTGRFEATATGSSTVGQDDLPGAVSVDADDFPEDRAEQTVLPHDAYFCDPEDLDAPPLDPREADNPQRLDWSVPIIFYPNGRASRNARIHLAVLSSLRIDITLRGLTGTAKIGRPHRVKQPEEQPSP